MKVLILGKNGQLGASLVAEFKKKHKVTSYSHDKLDIEDSKLIAQKIKKLKPNVIINASAYHVVPLCEDNIDKAYAINAFAVKNLADICKSIGAIFIHYSTDYVFDGKKGPYKETDTPNPLQIYGFSKYAGEMLVSSYADKYFMIRTCGVYGGKKGSASKGGNFVLTILNQIKDVDTLEVSSEQIVSPTYAPDLAKATLKLLEKKAPFGIYHLINEGECSWAEFAAEIARESKSKTKIIPVNRGGNSGGARRPLHSALINVKAKKIGIILPTWKKALAEYINYLNIK